MLYVDNVIYIYIIYIIIYITYATTFTLKQNILSNMLKINNKET